MKLQKASRLTSGPEFAKVRERGRTAQGKFLRLGVLSPADGVARVGLITSKRVGGAVVRNRVRRRLREIFRACLPEIPDGRWVVIVAKPPAADASFEELRGEWLLLARRLSILPPLP